MAAKPERRLSALDRAIESAMGEGRKVGREDDPGREKYPALWDWLSRIYIGRDRLKSPATVTIRLGPEGVLATMTDRDLTYSCDVACLYLDDALKALDAELAKDNPALKTWGKKEPQLRKRRTQN